MRWVLSIAVLGVACSLAMYWADKPIGAVCAQGGGNHWATGETDCSSCHEGTAPRTHTPEFIRSTHGPPAMFNRQHCLGCHKDEKKSCEECPLKDKPTWHTDAFCNPKLGWHERNEHTSVARLHRTACLECHTQRFQTQCASCHRPDEDIYR